MAEMLSLHYLHAGRPEKAWHFSRVAGDRAKHSYAYAEAAAFFRRAVEASRRFPALDALALAEVHEALGDAAAPHRRVCRRAHPFPYGASTAARRPRACGRPAAQGGPARVEAGPAVAVPPGPDASDARPRPATRPARRVRRWPAVDARVQLRVVPLPAGSLPRGAALGPGRGGARAGGGRPGRAGRGVRRAAGGRRHGPGTRTTGPTATSRSRCYEELGDRLQAANVLNNMAGSAFFEGRWSDALAMFEGAHAWLPRGRRRSRGSDRDVQPGGHRAAPEPPRRGGGAGCTRYAPSSAVSASRR